MNILEISINLLSAIAIFMFGMHIMCEGLNNIAQEKLKGFFTKTIRNPYMGAAVGLAVATILQSSTAPTVMVVGFVNAGLMSLYQAVGVIIGANVGTTLTGQMMAIRIADYIPWFLLIGTAFYLFTKKEKLREFGKIVLGFGLLFLGLQYMTRAMVPVAQSDFFQDLIVMLEGNALLGVVVGFFMSALLNSSTASKAIIMSLAATNAISLTVGIPIVLGTNIGTTVTAVISSMSGNVQAKKAAMIHLLYNVISVVLFLPFTNQFANFIDHLGGESPQQIANIHTFFNVICAMLLLPFSKYLIKLVDFIFKGSDKDVKVRRLDERFLKSPAVAYEQAFQESLKMYDLAMTNLQMASDALLHQQPKKLTEIVKNEKELNALETDISSFLVMISTRYKGEIENERIVSMIKTVSSIERIGDYAQSIARLGIEASKTGEKFSDEALAELKEIFGTTVTAVESAYESYKDSNYQKAIDTIKNEERIDILEDHLRNNHIERLNNNHCTAHSGAIFLDTISDLEGIGHHSAHIAESILKMQSVA